jgi:hypothetical protein
MRNIFANSIGGRPAPIGLGYTGSINATNASHGTTRCMSDKNCSRLVILRYASKLASAKLICFILLRSSLNKFYYSLERKNT